MTITFHCFCIGIVFVVAIVIITMQWHMGYLEFTYNFISDVHLFTSLVWMDVIYWNEKYDIKVKHTRRDILSRKKVQLGSARDSSTHYIILNIKDWLVQDNIYYGSPLYFTFHHIISSMCQLLAQNDCWLNQKDRLYF